MLPLLSPPSTWFSFIQIVADTNATIIEKVTTLVKGKNCTLLVMAQESPCEYIVRRCLDSPA